MVTIARELLLVNSLLHQRVQALKTLGRKADSLRFHHCHVYFGGLLRLVQRERQPSEQARLKRRATTSVKRTKNHEYLLQSAFHSALSGMQRSLGALRCDQRMPHPL